MLSWSQLPLLGKEESTLLSTFITTVLPPVPGSRYRIRYNELEFIHDAVNRWLYMNYRFHVPPLQLYQVFEANGYRIARTGYNEDADPKSEASPKMFSPYVDVGASKLHVNLHVPAIRMLRRHRTALHERSQPERVAEQQRFDALLEKFVQEYKKP